MKNSHIRLILPLLLLIPAVSVCTAFAAEPNGAVLPLPPKESSAPTRSGVVPVPVHIPQKHNTLLVAAPQFTAPKPPQAADVPAQPQQPLPPKILPNVPAAAPVITAPNIVLTHRLQTLTPAAFEQKMLDKLGSRFVAVRNKDNTGSLSIYQLPVQNDNSIELAIDRQNKTVTVTGSPSRSDAVVQIVRLLDTTDESEFMPLQKPNLVAVRHIAQVVNQETQRGTGTAAGAAPELSSGSVLGPVQIDVIDGLDTMVIKGSPKDVQVIQNLLRQLETMSLEHEPVIELVPLKNADSFRVGRLVQQLYAQVYLARRGNVTILPLIKPNTILMIGKDESIKAAKELLLKLDTAVPADANFQIFRLNHAAAATLATQITQSFTGRPGYGNGLETQISIVADYRTNALIVQGSPRDLVEVAAMIQQLDADGSNITNLYKTFPLKNAVATELATTLQNAFSDTGTTSGAASFGNAAASGTTNRGAMVTLGKVDKDGNVIRSSMLYDVKITADTRSNTVIVKAPQETMPLIAALITQLDQLPSAESQLKVFTLVNGDAYTLTTMLQNLFSSGTTSGGGFGGTTSTQSNQMAVVRPGIDENDSTLVGVRFYAEVRTNSIVACGTAGELVAVEALLLRLDAENTNNRQVMMLKLVNTPAEEIAPILQQYVENERQLEIQNSTTLLPQSPLEQYRKQINVVAEPIGNYLIVSTTPRYYNQVRKIVRELDERPMMAAIQVLIAEVRLTNSRDIGVELGLQDSLFFDRSLPGTTEGSLIPGFLFGDASQGLPQGNVRSGTVGTQGITGLGVNRSPASGIGGFTFSASSESVSVLVRALETQSRLRVLSTPNLVTMHNKRASVLVGQKVPFVSGVNTTNGTAQSQTEWNEVGTILDITPRIMPDGMIAMAVYVEKSSMGSEADGVPLYTSGTGANPTVIRQAKINKANAQTTVSAMDGQTVVFAGLITEQKETVTNSVPFLNKIPVVKHFFEYNSTHCERSELLIVMTPTIIRSREDMELLKQQETSRMQWCINDVVKLTGNTSMRLRSDEWQQNDIPLHKAEPVILDEHQLPSEHKVPVPTLAPVIQ
ncbi:MAG: hypothetical protein LBT89_05780 [Planctomycetaceae bacterium]|jgi:type II secretion system protein D|nr:hypothetical protein [Planctomycetaceae bacterium]